MSVPLGNNVILERSNVIFGLNGAWIRFPPILREIPIILSSSVIFFACHKEVYKWNSIFSSGFFIFYNTK